MTDVELARALERNEIANKNFHHLSHLHVAWVYLSETANDAEAAAKMRVTLRKFTGAAGKPEKYHETITVFWVRVLAALRQSGQADTLEQIVRKYPRLLDKDFPLVYYSRERLFSSEARTSWIDPDRKPLPADATALDSSHSPGDAPNCALSQ